MKPTFFKSINIGITSKCNAKCAYCNRQSLPDYPHMNKDMSLHTFRKILRHTEEIQFCGSFGDFTCHENSLGFAVMAKHYAKFYIETNGAKDDDFYWEGLAHIADSPDHAVQFSVDDVSNPWNPYRNVLTAQVLRNIKIFTDAGGYARVKTLKFKFNENQPIRETMYELGVQEFFEQYSTIYEPGTILEAPTDFPHVTGTLPFIYNTASLMSSRVKRCPWQDMQACYIMDNGEVHVCCNILPWAAHLQDLLPGVGKYTHPSNYTTELELYRKNKELINLNHDFVTLESAWNNDYNVFVRENFQKIPKCNQRCLIQNITKPIDGVQRV